MNTSRRPFIFLLALILLLSACQAALPTASTPAAENTPLPSRTPAPSATSTPLPPTVTPTPSPNLLVTPQSLNGIHVRFWHPYSGNTALQLVTLVDEFNRTNDWGIFVEAREIGSSGQLFEALQTEYADPQTRPHLVAASIDQLLALQQIAAADTSIQSPLLVNLNDYMNSAEIGLSLEELLDFPLVFWDQDEIAGYRYGIPFQRTGDVLFYNLTWAQELGFTSPPATPEEFKAQACAAAKSRKYDADPNNRGTGGWIIDTDPLPILSWMFSFGADRMPDEPEGAYHLNTPAVLNAFTYLQDLYSQDCAWVSRLPDPALYFANRQALVYSGSLTDIPMQARVMDNAENKDQWLVLPYPHQDSLPVLVVSGTSLAILQASPQEQMAAWLFIHWMIDPERLARMDSASASFPVRISSLDFLTSFRQQYPQWSQAFSWLSWAQPAPRQPSWRSARWVISDAAWNLFNPNVLPTPIPFILEQAETTIPEIIPQP